MIRKGVCTAVVLLLGASIAGATTLVKMNFSDLAREADLIVVGTVTEIDGEWDSSRTFIHSNVTLSVERSFRGQVADSLVVRTPGGQVGDAAQFAHGAPSFTVGEKVLVFLTSWEDGVGKVVGYVQGKSRVAWDEQGRPRLRGGSAEGRLLDEVERELRDGPRHNIPLRPANQGGER